MPAWQAHHASLLPMRPPGPTLLRIVLVVLIAGAFAVTYLSTRKGPQSIWANLTFGYIVAVLANVLIPHLPATLVLRSYTPGVVTACFINLPVMSVLAVKAVQERYVAGGKAVAFAIMVPVVLGVFVAALFGSLSILH